MAASDSAYRNIYDTLKLFDVWILLQTYGSKVINEKYLSRRLCEDRADGRVDMEHTNSQVSRRYDELITKEAAKTKEQAATAIELMLELEIAK